ncbi:hypothetical protein J1N35_010377 [Gossypium stocksii]|uniref:RNase H type-1 domain-containing protein n=1 Tax=Gossypium stocksii TaxID=47602 RepID=A0A9D3W0A5_9ROSI|nr:hypothetical protein J1N35_010377 [Gossypium stocksii]
MELLLGTQGYRNVWIQTDNLEMVKVLSSNVASDSGIVVLRRVKRILSTEGLWEIKYVNRDRNLIADQLAKLNLSRKSPFQILDAPPDSVVSLLQRDMTFRSP